MKPIFTFLLLVLVLTLNSVCAQTKYIVYFNNKDTAGFNPYTFFDQKAIDRRVKNNIPLFDYSDVPVNKNYVKEIGELVDSVSQVSRWLNSITVYTKTESLQKISKLSFVQEVQELKALQKPCVTKYMDEEISDTFNSYTRLRTEQRAMLEAEEFSHHSLNGQGVRIALLDIGYSGAETHKAFDSLRVNKGIIKTYDFLGKQDKVYHGGVHGSSCLSCIAGKYDGKNLGCAPNSEFLLARTERLLSESMSEEDAWLAAAEWADKNGADIISSSLGYTYRYFPSDMNGKTSLIAKAATMASRKGILVIVAAGNEGEHNWKFIATPGDADSILTIGGEEPYTRYHSNFSSFGPTRDLRLKPDVCGAGSALVATHSDYAEESGTSFATPLVAGFAACVMQLHPDWTNVKLMEEIRKSGNLYPYYDYAHGYGLPRASYFTETLAEVAPTFEMQFKNDTFYFSNLYKNDSLNSDSNMKKRNEWDDYFYYNVRQKNGAILKYQVLKLKETSSFNVSLSDFLNNIEGQKSSLTFSFQFRGFTLNYDYQ